MSGFKLLAIRPLKGCSNEFIKVLKPGVVYSFYNDYEFIRDNEDDVHSEINSIIFNQELPEDFYNTKHLIINISALVGKNGSGKSTLMDLLFAAIYLLSIEKNVLFPNLRSIAKIRKQIVRELKSLVTKQENLNQKKIRQNDTGIISFVETFDFFKMKIENCKKEIHRLDALQIDINRLNKGVKVEIFYELDGNIYNLIIGKKSNSQNKVSLKIIQGNKSIIRDNKLNYLLDEETTIDFENLFYTIAISYSHYALNAKEIGPWINSLFHKNDGYQTPVVINPMRIEGNIDVNKEKVLVNQRLLSNILEPVVQSKIKDSLRELAPGKIAKTLKLRLKSEKIEEFNDTKRVVKNANEVIKRLYFTYTNKNYNSTFIPEPALNFTEIYLVSKIVKICETYSRYEKYLLEDRFDDEFIQEFVEKLILDSSHITFKLKQALNFIRFKLYIDWKNNHEAEIDIETYADHIIELKKELKSDRENVEKTKKVIQKYLTIEFVPPSIYDIDIIMEDGSSFNDLSSGEKQRVYSLSTIGYHVMNINSVFDNGFQHVNNKIIEFDKYEVKLLAYRNINILFDEVEQYFHPDFQRQFVGDLLSYIGKLNPELTENLKSINILFATHSPFILSDIPISNTLRIDEGNVQKIPSSNTFGANIYDLLFDNFFMKDGFVGSFAMKKISEVLDYINNQEFDEKKNNNFEKIVSLISDEIISDKLMTSLFDKRTYSYQNKTELERLTIERSRIDERINKLKGQDDIN